MQENTIHSKIQSIQFSTTWTQMIVNFTISCDISTFHREQSMYNIKGRIIEHAIYDK